VLLVDMGVVLVPLLEQISEASELERHCEVLVAEMLQQEQVLVVLGFEQRQPDLNFLLLPAGTHVFERLVYRIILHTIAAYFSRRGLHRLVFGRVLAVLLDAGGSGLAEEGLQGTSQRDGCIIVFGCLGLFGGRVWLGLLMVEDYAGGIDKMCYFG
jgi:hypothetical protein